MNERHGHGTILARTLLVAALVALAPSGAGAGDERLGDLVERITADDDASRLEGRRLAREIGAAAVKPLTKVFLGDDREAAISARHALTELVHHAGRPGAGEERAAVAAELLKLVRPETSRWLRLEAIHLIAYIGGADEVAGVAGGLWDEDRHVVEASRMALERIPGKAALAALSAAARRASGALQAELVYSISKKNDLAAGPLLVELAAASDAQVRFACLEGLARLGAAEGVALLSAALANESDPLRDKIYNEFLRLADNLAERGDRTQAAKLYRIALKSAPLDFQRERALHRLCPSGEESVVNDLLVGLRDASVRVRNLAQRRMGKLQGAGVTRALVKGYEEADEDRRPLLLRALADRDPDSARPFLASAARSANAELKITALDLEGRLGDPSLEALYLRVVEEGSAFIRPTAIRGYLAVASKHLENGTSDKALAMFSKALEVAGEDQQRVEALEGLIAVGKPEAIDRLEPLLKDPLLSSQAADGFIAFAGKIAAAGDVDLAERHLMKIVAGTFPRELIQRAAADLTAMGRDPQRRAKAKGFVLDWWVTGPIQDRDGNGLGEKYFAEEAIRLEAVERIGPRRYRWRRLPDLSLDGRINLVPVFRRSERSIAYAYAEIEVDGAKDVLFKMGSDDGIACWLNGDRLHYKPVERGLTVDEDSVPARLEAGKNKILLKISNGSGGWEYCLRITDRAGEALDLSR